MCLGPQRGQKATKVTTVSLKKQLSRPEWALQQGERKTKEVEGPRKRLQGGRGRLCSMYLSNSLIPEIQRLLRPEGSGTEGP